MRFQFIINSNFIEATGEAPPSTIEAIEVVTKVISGKRFFPVWKLKVVSFSDVPFVNFAPKARVDVRVLREGVYRYNLRHLTRADYYEEDGSLLLYYDYYEVV